jgi:hypothetical protein
MPSAISLTGASGTDRTSFYHFDGSQFTNGRSLSNLPMYETCYKSVDPRQRFVAVGHYAGHFTFGYHPVYGIGFNMSASQKPMQKMEVEKLVTTP